MLGSDGMTNVDGGNTKVGKDGKKIVELGDPPVVGATVVAGGGAAVVADGGGATVVAVGGFESAGAVSPGIVSPTIETSELDGGSSESFPPSVLYKISAMPISRTMTEIGVSDFFHMSADSSTARRAHEPLSGTSTTQQGLVDTISESAHRTTRMRSEPISNTAT
jgi:hypothetical protein